MEAPATASSATPSSPTPGWASTIEFFANAVFDPSGYGEGEVYLGFVDVTTDASGLARFTFTYTADPARPHLTATATDPAGNTSEFSGRDLPPVNFVPGPQPTDRNVPLAFSGATAPSITDPDNNGTDPLQITLTVRNGTLTLASLAGLTGSGNGTASLTYAGTLAALNAALANLVYTPALGFDGSDLLTLLTSDLVARELGGPGTAASAVPITVVDTVNAPNLAVSDASGNEGQAIPLDIRASTVDTDGSETLSVEISGVPAAAMLSAGISSGSGVWILTATELAGLTLNAADNFAAILTVRATTTQAGTGATAATTRTLTVTAANLPPTATLSNGGPVAAGEGGLVLFAEPFDPSPADAAAGFRYSFALSAAERATSYDAADPESQRLFVFDQAGTYLVHGRLFDRDGGFTDYPTAVLVIDTTPPPPPEPPREPPPPEPPRELPPPEPPPPPVPLPPPPPQEPLSEPEPDPAASPLRAVPPLATPEAPAQLVMWLAVPVAVALTAAGWLWYRAGGRQPKLLL